MTFTCTGKELQSTNTALRRIGSISETGTSLGGKNYVYKNFLEFTRRSGVFWKTNKKHKIF